MLRSARLALRATVLSSRQAAPMSSKASEAPQFDPDMVKAYTKMSSNHRHADGPWLQMRSAVLAHCAELAEASSSDDTKGVVILDLASGPGEPAATIAAALPSCKVIATDVSEDMVATAAKVAEALPNLSAEVGDAQDLSGFADQSVDIVTCCYGYMFPSDKEMALRETYRVLKPGGLLVATTWDNVDILKIARDIMEGVIGEPPPPPPLNPMSLSGEGVFRDLVTGAGFVGVTQTTSTYPFNLGNEKDFQFKMATLLIKDKVESFGALGWNKAESAFWANIGKYSAIHANGDMVMPENTFRLTVARKE